MLSEQQLKEIEELQRECETGESFLLKLNWDMLLARNGQEKTDFFHYENGKLVGFIGIYGFGNSCELCGMIAPDYRRKGLFTELFKKVEKEVRDRGFTDILVNAPTDSSSAKEFLQTINCKYEFSEYQMKWQGTGLIEDDGEVNVRATTERDLDSEIRIDVQSFKMEEEEAKDFNKRLKQEKSNQFYMIEADGQTVGKIRVSHSDGEAWIFGFSVLPEFQGKGIGKRALSNVVMKNHRLGLPIFLEVEAKNANALKLYEGCGFKSYQSQDYYRLFH